MNVKQKILPLIIVLLVIILLLVCLILGYNHIVKTQNKWGRETPLDTKTKKNLSRIAGSWIADGTQYQVVYSVDKEGNINGSDNTTPMYLTITKDGSYILKQEGSINETGKCNMSDNLVIRFFDNDAMDWYCKLEDNQIKCDVYATSFMQKNKVEL